MINKIFNFAPRKTQGGLRVPLTPSTLCALELDSNLKEDCQSNKPRLNSEFHKTWVFRFSYSFQGFRNPLLSSLLTLQSYDFFLKYTNFFKIIFIFSAIFFTFFSLINQFEINI